MTFCLGITVRDGLIGIADTRVLSGHECLTAKKLTVYQRPGLSAFLMTSGLRSLRDKTLLYFEEELSRTEEPPDRLFKLVNMFAMQLRRVAGEDKEAIEDSGLKFNLHALIGGQATGDASHKLYLVYPEGNWVEVGPHTPYQIIGASGYGKPILTRSINYDDSMAYVFKVGVLAFDSTQLCAADVGYPIDVVLCRRDSFQIVEHRYEKEDLQNISNWWQERMRLSVSQLPSEWVERAFLKLGPQPPASHIPDAETSAPEG